MSCRKLAVQALGVRVPELGPGRHDVVLAADYLAVEDALLTAQEERDQWKRAAHGDRDGVVTHEYHLHMLKAVVAERQAAQERAQEAEETLQIEREMHERTMVELRALDAAEGQILQLTARAEAAESQVAELKEALKAIGAPGIEGAEQYRDWAKGVARAALTDEAKPE